MLNQLKFLYTDNIANSLKIYACLWTKHLSLMHRLPEMFVSHLTPNPLVLMAHLEQRIPSPHTKHIREVKIAKAITEATRGGLTCRNKIF